MSTERADALVIGGGLAGLYAVLHLPDHWSVVVVDKGATRQSGSSPLAQGGMAVAVDPEDSPDLHARDTAIAGAALCVAPAVDVLVHGAVSELASLLELGCAFDRTPSGDLDLHREAGQSVARSVHWADATGKEIMRVVIAAARRRATRLLGSASGLLLSDGRCAGARVTTGEGTGGGTVDVVAPVTLLATGGCGALYESTTNVPEASGDGVAVAYEAGAAVAGLEFVQFHPTALATGGLQRVLLTEALRGSGAVVVDDDGKRFLFDHHPDGELAPRDVVARAIAGRGGALLDATSITDVSLKFPNIAAAVGAAGFDLAGEAIPVAPAAHFLLGGVMTDVDGRTTLPGLYAAGECAWTGVHGANRMAGNSLAETVVFGRRAAQAMVREAPRLSLPPDARAWRVPHQAAERRGSGDEDAAWTRLRSAMTDGTGLVRTRAGLAATLGVCEAIASSAPSDALRLAAVTAGLITRSALLRNESRGTHYREDHPGRHAEWDGAAVVLRHG